MFQWQKRLSSVDDVGTSWDEMTDQIHVTLVFQFGIRDGTQFRGRSLHHQMFHFQVLGSPRRNNPC